LKIFGKSLNFGLSGNQVVTPGDELWEDLAGAIVPPSARDLSNHWAVRSVTAQIARGVFGVDAKVATFTSNSGPILVTDQRGLELLRPYLRRIVYDVLRYGAHVSVVARDSRNTPRDLIPMAADEVSYDEQTKVFTKGTEKWTADKLFIVSEEIPWCSPLESLRGVIEEDWEASNWRRESWRSPRGMVERGLEAPEWSGRARERFQHSFGSKMRGGAKGEVPLLEDGMAYKPTASPDATAMQYIESRRFCLEAICDLYGVQSSLLASGADKQVAVARRQLYHGPVTDICNLISLAYAQQLSQSLYGATNGSNMSLHWDIAGAVRKEDEDPSVTSAAVGTPWRTVEEQRDKEGLPFIKDTDKLASPQSKAVVTADH
jgi:phage portal protein BeeE